MREGRQRVKRVELERLERRRLLALTGQYFDSPDFSDLKLTRSDATVDFTWTGAPDASMAVNHFSVRWLGQVQPQFSQEYTFYITSDDGARLWVDGRLLVDNWVNQLPTEKSGKITLEAGQKYDIRLDYYEFDQSSQAKLSWSSASQAKQVIPSARTFASPAGLDATYFDNQNFTGKTVSTIDSAVDFTWGTASPASGIGGDTFSGRWTGFVRPTTSETYTFTLTGDADATMKLRVDGQIVVDTTSVQDGGVIKLEADKWYPIELEYAENTGSANVKLEWASPTVAKQVIPNARLAASTKTAVPTKQTLYTNSVEDRDLPDPGIIYADGYYWMTHTMGGPDKGWPLYQSPDGVTWTFQKHLLTTTNKPAYMTDAFWAPEIHKINGTYVVTGTSWSSTYNHLILAIGTSSTINGTYTIQTTPIVADVVSTLDSHIFQDYDGRVYLVWKRDSNAGTGPNGSIRIRELDPTTLRFTATSTETQILDNAVGGWENFMAEGPWMIHRGSYYYLFYSGGRFNNATYAEGVARATSINGPYTRYSLNPIMASNSTWGGPGHGGFALDRDGALWHLYHARHQSDLAYGRVQMLDKVLWTADNWPTFANTSPSFTEQTGPRVFADSGFGAISLAGDATLADAYTIRRSSADSSNLEIVLNGAVIDSRRFAEVQSITLDGRGGNDTLTIDHSLGDAIPGGGVTFHGSGGTNTITIIGDPDELATRFVAAGKAIHGTGALIYDGVQKVQLQNGAYRFDANLAAMNVEVTNADLAFNVTQTLGQLDLLAGGVAAMAVGGARVLKASGVTVASTGRLDMADNDLLVDYAGVTSPIGGPVAGTYTGITGLLQKGRGEGAWDGVGGIGTSMPAARGFMTGLGVAEASQVLDFGAATTKLWEGVTIDATTVVVKYTWAGDANLDGVVSGDDYSGIDFSIVMPGSSGYSNGDFNYDGVISGDDYSVIDFMILAQGAAL
jgi:GH43 family beta-xylosidase